MTLLTDRSGACCW